MSDSKGWKPKPYGPGTPKGHDAAYARFLELIAESGDEMDFSGPAPPPEPGDIMILILAVRRKYERIRASFDRLWLWNVVFPVKMWLHFRFHREKPLPNDRYVIKALLRDAFSEAEITDADLPYPIVAHPITKL